MNVEQARLPAALDPPDQPSPVRGLLLRYGVDIAAPIAFYYVLHGAGVSNLPALVLSATVPAASAAVELIGKRRAEPVALLVLASFLATIVASLISHNPRFILAKEGLLTGVWGIWFVASVAARRPAAFIFARPLMEGRRVFGTSNWDVLWEREPRFRRIWRISSVLWGAAFLIDAGIRVAIAYLLPVHDAPAIGGALWPVTFVAIQVVTNVYYHWAGLYRILGARWLAR